MACLLARVGHQMCDWAVCAASMQATSDAGSATTKTTRTKGGTTTYAGTVTTDAGSFVSEEAPENETKVQRMAREARNAQKRVSRSVRGVACVPQHMCPPRHCMHRPNTA